MEKLLPMNRMFFEGVLVTQDITEEQKEVIRTAKQYDHDYEAIQNSGDMDQRGYCPCFHCADSTVDIKQVSGIEDGHFVEMFDLIGINTGQVIHSVGE